MKKELVTIVLMFVVIIPLFSSGIYFDFGFGAGDRFFYVKEKEYVSTEFFYCSQATWTISSKLGISIQNSPLFVISEFFTNFRGHYNPEGDGRERLDTRVNNHYVGLGVMLAELKSIPYLQISSTMGPSFSYLNTFTHENQSTNPQGSLYRVVGNIQPSVGVANKSTLALGWVGNSNLGGSIGLYYFMHHCNLVRLNEIGITLRLVYLRSNNK